jgi:hypothetical protein
MAEHCGVPKENIMFRHALVIALIALVLAPLAAAQVGTTGPGAREEFTAVAISSGGIRSAPVAANLDIVIERWSTDADRDRLMEALKKGQDAALDVMRDLPRVGSIRTPGNLAWDLHYSHQMPGEDGGRRIFLATDRPMSFAEIVTRPLLNQYPFTFIELRLNDDGEGEGKLTRATRVIASDDGRFVHLENYETQPVDLTQVKRR